MTRENVSQKAINPNEIDYHSVVDDETQFLAANDHTINKKNPLDTIMPDGRQLREWTSSEIRALERRCQECVEITFRRAEAVKSAVRRRELE